MQDIDIIERFRDKSYVYDAIIKETIDAITEDSQELILERTNIDNTNISSIKNLVILFEDRQHAGLIFVKYLFNDHVTLHAIKWSGATNNFIIYNESQKMMPKMKHISNIVCSIARDEKIDNKWLHKNAPKLRSHLYGQRLWDIVIETVEN